MGTDAKDSIMTIPLCVHGREKSETDQCADCVELSALLWLDSITRRKPGMTREAARQWLDDLADAHRRIDEARKGKGAI
jgi:hypothetical protein